MKIFLDLEDSYQYQAALAADCECLITGNIKDFKDLDSPLIDIVTPKEFYN